MNNFWMRHGIKARICGLKCVLFIALINTPAWSQASINLQKGLTLSEAFQRLSKQSGFHIFTESAVMTNFDSILLKRDFKNASLKECLSALTGLAGLYYQKVGKTIYLKEALPGSVATAQPSLSAQQEITVTGTVYDEHEQVLPGVSVTAKSTGRGVQTDLDGKYEIEIAEGDLLVFSFIGYQAQEVPVPGSGPVDITLQQSLEALDEIIVTGYSTQARRNITSAVSTIASKDLTSVPATNLAQQMQGRAAGVNVGLDNTPGGGVSVRIRGISTLGNNDPLYIIDGVPSKGNLNTINQNDIETIQVLKDASSASIYGSRAANGVVIITTKKGSAGTPKITFDAYYGMQRAGKLLDLMDTREYAEYIWQSRINANVVNPSTGFPEHAQFGEGPEPVIPDYIVPDGASEGDPRVHPDNYSWGRYTDPEFGNTRFAITPANKQGTRWMEEIFSPAPIQNYQLGAAGGSDNGRYAFSLNYFNQEGILEHNGYQRYTARANTEFTIKDRVRIGENLQIGYGRRQGNYANHGESNSIQSAYRAQPIIPVYDLGGNFAGTLGSNLGNANNPVAQLVRNKDNGYQDLRLFGNAYAEADILTGFTARTSFGIDATASSSKYYNPVEIETAHLANINSLNENKGYDYTWTWTNTMTYDRVFGGIHQFTAFAGLEAIKGYGEGLGAVRQGFFTDHDPNIRYLNTGSPSTATNSGDVQTSWALFSYFGRVDYAYRDKYLLQATLRRDASSRFLAATRYATFPAVSAGWRISAEPFMEHVSFLTDLKIRAGWGRTGNQEIGDFNAYSTYHSNPRTSGYGLSGDPRSYDQGFDMARFGNPNARWETSTSANAGLDATLFEGKLELTLDVYDRKTTDLLYTRAYDPRLGDATVPSQNIASMQNKGLDLAVNFNQTAESGFSYSVGANFSTYRNKILELDPLNPDDFLPGFGLRSPAVSRSVAGMPISSYFGYIVDGIMQSEEEVENHARFPGYYDSDIYINGERMQGVGKFKFRDVNGDGVINAADQTFIGNPHPDFTYGINVYLAYKSFDLTIFGQGVQGNNLFNHVRYWTDFELFQGNRDRRMLYDSWTPDNPDARLPVLDANDAQSGVPSTYFVEDGSYFRLKNLQLGYTLPEQVSSRLLAGAFRVYIQAQNLITITGYSGLDPEINLRNYGSGSDREIGVDFAGFPTPRSFIFGLSVEF